MTSAPTKKYLDATELERLETAFRHWAKEAGARGSEAGRARMLLMFLLVRYTGSKLSEVLRLNLHQDIDVGQKTVTFNGIGKSGKARKVEISSALADEAGDLLLALQNDGGRGFAVDPSLVRRVFYARAVDCGLDPACAGPEMIRKARAIELVQNKLPLPVVERLFGRLAPNPSLQSACFSDNEMHRLTRLFMDKETGAKSSARNHFYGKVRGLSRSGVQTLVEIAATDGEPLLAMITNASVSRLGLKPGMLVTAEVKAPWMWLESVGRSGSASADNEREGVVASVTKGKINVECVVKTVGSDLAVILCAHGFKKLALGPGDPVKVMFGAHAVILRVE